MNDRRRTFDHLRITERIDAIVAHVREEEGREQAKLLDEIARLRAENERLRGAVAKAAAVAASVHMLAAGAGAGECEGCHE